MWDDPYVVAQRDWWSGTWRIWAGNRVIDAVAFVGFLWMAGGRQSIETDDVLVAMGLSIGVGFYFSVRNWLSAMFATSSGDDGIGAHSRGILNALRKVGMDATELYPRRIDGLMSVMNDSRISDEHRLFAASLYATIKATAIRLPQHRKIAYENAADLAILQYALETSAKPPPNPSL